MLLIEAKQLGCRYGEQVALEGLSLEVQSGEIVGLFGANGAGKTTTFKILSGLLQPTAGSFTLLGMPVSRSLHRTSVLLDPPAFYPNLTASGNIEVALAYSGQSLSRGRVQTILEQVGLRDDHKRVGGYSNGMKKRLALAIAMAKSPELLLLDEPTNGLDLDGVDLFIRLLKEMVGAGAGCLISTHEWDVAERLVDRVVILERGRVVCSSPLSRLVSPGDQWFIQSDDARVAVLLEATPGLQVMHKDLTKGEYIVRLVDIPIERVTEALVAAGCVPKSVSAYKRPLADVYRTMVHGRRP